MTGAKTPRIGVIKDPRNSSELRERWKAHPSVIQVTLKSLGFSGRLDRGPLVVCCWGAAIPDRIEFVRELARSSMQPMVLLVGPDASGKLMDPLAMPAWVAADQPHLQCFPLPSLTWSQMDEVVWSSDLMIARVTRISAASHASPGTSYMAGTPGSGQAGTLTSRHQPQRLCRLSQTPTPLPPA